MPPKRKFSQYMTPEGTPESSRGCTGSSPTAVATPSAQSPKRQCHDGRARNAKPGHSPTNLFGTVPKKPAVELPRPARTSAEAFRRVQIPSNYTFIHLHHLVLFLFGWTGVHAHRFTVQNNITMHPSRRGQVKSGSLFIDVSPPRPPPTKREKREAQRLARALAKSNMRENPSDDSDTDWEGPGAWRPLVLDQVSVRQRSEEALTIGEVFGAHVCRRGRAIIYEYDPTHDEALKLHITLIDLVQHDEPDQLSSPPAWPALPPLPPSSPIRSIASSPYTPRGRLFSSGGESSSPVRPSTRSGPGFSFTEEEDDLPQRPPLNSDRTNLPWLVIGQGLPPPERELFVADSVEDENPIPPGSAKRGKTKKRPGGFGLRAAKPVEIDAGLFNDGPDGEEGTAFTRWLAGELFVEREEDTLVVKDKTHQLKQNREQERAKSAGWDSDEDDQDPPEEYLPQQPVAVEPFEPAPEGAEDASDEESAEEGTKDHPVDVDGDEDENENEEEAVAQEEDDDADPGFWD
ncbi:plasmid pRiA4b ORF-like protein [Ceratobasidium sp. AG-Ba]|nr:plasmid pRiA4b ORF-like protein [Ceratobasidium sp. AG-Ba]